MKIVDEKGRLFGKVNVVDFIIVVVIAGVLSAAAYKIITAKISDDTAVAAVTGDVYLTVKARLQPEEVLNNLKVGDKLVARNAFQNAEIVSVDSEPALWVAWTDEGEAISTVHPIWKDIIVVVKDKCDVNSPIVRVGGQEARMGKEFILKTQFIEVPSIAYDISFK